MRQKCLKEQYLHTLNQTFRVKTDKENLWESLNQLFI